MGGCDSSSVTIRSSKLREATCGSNLLSFRITSLFSRSARASSLSCHPSAHTSSALSKWLARALFVPATGRNTTGEAAS